MEDVLSRIVENLMGRVSGPMKFRLVLQPLMSAFLAIRSGLRDAKENKPPFFWAMFTDAQHRAEMMRDGWKSMSRVFILGLALDAVYQFIVFRWFYPVEALLVATVLALVPYLLIRGPANRMARRKQ